MYDTIIIGAGPAGLSAAIYGIRAQLRLIVLEQNPMSGGQIVDTYEVDNYPGLPGLSGFDLAQNMRDHADKLGAMFKTGDVTNIICKSEGDETTAPCYTVQTTKESFDTKTVILATGATHAHLGVPGEAELSGAGVSYCATCDGAFFRGKTAVVVGGGDVAVEDAIFLARGCEKVYLIHRRDELRAAKILQKELLSLPNAEVVWDSVVTSVLGTGSVEGVTVENVKTGEKRIIDCSACFMAVGITPRAEYCKNLVETDEKGFVRADESTQTNRPGVFAAGDIRTKRLRQVITAAADGACAITSVTDFLTGKV
ncbi:MAG: FAD-dependent oxidoreductase [Lachnospiraceae bacterium]|nr:FAD-dependent oxidoreductase [Lachnospiraceae bacterium]